MLINKEIQIVGLRFRKPDDITMEEWLSTLSNERKDCLISHDTSNLYDDLCMTACIDGKCIGSVNSDDVRYILPMVNRYGFLNAHFKEVYKREGHTEILRYTAMVDLDLVQPLKADEEWDSWEYDGPVLHDIREWREAEDCANALLLELQNISQMKQRSSMVENLIERLALACRYDMSVEMTAKLNDIAFCMEMEHDPLLNEWKNKIEWASTQRRTEKTQNEILKGWFPEFVSRDNCSMLICDHKKGKQGMAHYSTDDLNARLEAVEQKLCELPKGLHRHTDALNRLLVLSYYTNIPREKLLQLLSLLVMRNCILCQLMQRGDKSRGYLPYIGCSLLKNGTAVNEYHFHGETNIESFIHKN